MTINIYIDEAGSMCLDPKLIRDRNFIIAAVRVNNVERCKRRMKRFISRNMERLKESDAATFNKMFRNGKFIELKGSCMTMELEFELLTYLCDQDLIEIHIITVANKKVKSYFYDNTARAFNYLLKLMIEDGYRKKFFANVSKINMHLDDRNVRTDTIYALNEYINTVLVVEHAYFSEIDVTYYQSECCKLVQLADIIANVRHRALHNEEYKDFLNNLLDKGYIKNNFRFPIY